MTLATCQQCWRQVSADSAFCPGCGAKKPTNRKTSWVAWAAIAFMLFAVAKACSGTTQATAEVRPIPMPAAMVAPVEAASLASAKPLTAIEARAKKLSAARGEPPEFINGCCFMCGQYLKRTANDPDSIECVQSSRPNIEGETWTTTTTFRGKNGFGALVLGKKKFFLQNNRVVDVK